tara:strand:- start:232 stop:849 length:618 start_codon:yes stop_codon:yes gene_type:complete
VRKFNKIFQVGMAKTGTLSLCHSLIQLGIPTLHWWSYGDPLPDSVGFDKKGYGIEGLKYLKNNMTFIKEMGYDKIYDAFTEIPFLGNSPLKHRYLFLHKLPVWYSNSLFIYLDRNVDTWWDSLIGHSRRYDSMAEVKELELMKEELYFRFYESIGYDKGVLSTLPTENVLYMNICDDGDGWKKLCNFLETDIPDKKFPHRNRGIE